MRFPRAGFVTPHPGGFGQRKQVYAVCASANCYARPALRPVREVLAALAPGRVLPFAPGNSRKRGPEMSRAIGEVPQWSAGRRARPRIGALRRPAHWQAATSTGVARTFVGCASRRSAPLGLLRGEKDWLGGLQTSGAGRVARADFYFHLSPVGRGREPTGPARSGRPDDRLRERVRRFRRCRFREVGSPSPASHLRCSVPSPHWGEGKIGRRA